MHAHYTDIHYSQSTYREVYPNESDNGNALPERSKLSMVDDSLAALFVDDRSNGSHSRDPPPRTPSRHGCIETPLIVSRWASETLKYEGEVEGQGTDHSSSVKHVKSLASHCYSHNDVRAAVASGSFQTDGMIVVPCSMRALSAVRTGHADDLICRASDVTIKEHRRLVLVTRETPLSPIHLDNMLALARAQNVVIFPPMPAFYTRPKTLEDIVDQSVGRMMDMLGRESGRFPRWEGMGGTRASSKP
ncbi:phenylacrylic acid decarboxylase [Rhinocladiella similis]